MSMSHTRLDNIKFMIYARGHDNNILCSFNYSKPKLNYPQKSNFKYLFP